MPRAAVIFVAICLLPYAYAVWFWGFTDTTRVSGEAILLTVLLFVALPFWIGIAAWMVVAGGVREAAGAIVDRKPLAFARGTLIWYLALGVAVSMTATAVSVYVIANPDVEEGRDRLGRICEKEGSSTVCRPDPDREPGMFDRTPTVGELQEKYG